MACFGDETSEEDVKDRPLCECGDCHLDEYGEAIEGCPYSPIACEKCKYRPCDLSC